MIVMSVLLLVVLSGCAKSAGEAWFTKPKIPQIQQPDMQEMMCRQFDFFCKQGQQQYCDLYAQQCVPKSLQAKALILVNDKAPSSDVILGADAAVILQRYNAVPNTKLDSEVYLPDVQNYDVVVRILDGDVNILYSDSVQFRDISLELKTDLRDKRGDVPVSLKKLNAATVRDLCEIDGPEQVSETKTIEVALQPAGSGVFLGNLLMEGKTYKLSMNSNTRILRITLPDKTLQDIALDQNLKGKWNCQGKTWFVKIDLVNLKATFITG